MKKIPLTRGLFAMIDDNDYEFISQRKWHATKSKASTIYAKSWTLKSEGKPRLLCMHRELLGLGEGRSIVVDHINGNGLNNCRNNLRIATVSQNSANRRVIPKKNTIYKGVSWHKAAKKWRATIQKDSKLIHIGYFKSDLDAALAYNREALNFHGEFANLNKIA